MNKTILNIEIQEFINLNIDSNINALLLKGIVFPDIDMKTIIEQIEAKQRSKVKLSTWFSTENIYYPNKLNIEQTSSEITAKYKSELIEGDSIIDITGGFGVDCFYFSKRFKKVTHCELNETLSEIVSHNYEQLHVDGIETIHTNGISYLMDSDNSYDWIYVDPSRRHDSKGKVFFLNDCLPNVPAHLDLLFSRSKHILIKTSPLLDFSVGIKELKHVKTIHVIAVNNEVKELLWILEADYDAPITIKTINIKKETQEVFNFTLEDEKNSASEYSESLAYLYEPNAAILKAGAFDQIANQLQLHKLHKHSHLYTSDTLTTFPGRAFKIDSILPYNKKIFKKLGITKANITTRNFPESVQKIRKKLNIKDGGDLYLFFTTDIHDQKIVLITNKVAS